MPKHVVISLMSRDRVGIIAAVAKSIYGMGGTIEAITQTVMQEYFTILLIADFSTEISLNEVKKNIEGSGRQGEFHVSVKERDGGQHPGTAKPESDQFVLTITGANQPDIISRLSSFLAGRNINIIDLYANTRDEQFLLIGQVTIPHEQDIMHVQIDLKSLWKDYPLTVNVQHENIFAATNEIAFSHSKLNKISL